MVIVGQGFVLFHSTEKSDKTGRSHHLRKHSGHCPVSIGVDVMLWLLSMNHRKAIEGRVTTQSKKLTTGVY